MSILIDKKRCIGCRKCLSVCPGNLIKLGEDGKAFMKYPKDCWGCTSCLKECEYCAIALYLGADMGGRGSLLTTRTEQDIVHWDIEKSNGTKHTIDVNRKDSNQY